MIIGNKSVRGMYLYDASLKFEYGDFVVYDHTIYVCKPIGNTYVAGEIPGTGEQYIPYPGEWVGSVDEYRDYEKNVTSSTAAIDKYVSAKALYQILQSQFFGFDAQGIIGDIYSTSDLDTLIFDSESNNGMVLVSRKIFMAEQGLASLPEIYDAWVEDGYCVLRQNTWKYTKDNTEYTMRSQECFDFVTGYYFSRFADFDTGYISPWKSGIEVESSLLAKYNRLKNYYAVKSLEDAQRVKALESLYCHRNLADIEPTCKPGVSTTFEIHFSKKHETEYGLTFQSESDGSRHYELTILEPNAFPLSISLVNQGQANSSSIIPALCKSATIDVLLNYGSSNQATEYDLGDGVRIQVSFNRQDSNTDDFVDPEDSDASYPYYTYDVAVVSIISPTNTPYVPVEVYFNEKGNNIGE